MPDDLGASGGLLGGCPESPNCVSSASPTSDEQHSIAPFAVQGDGPAAWTALVATVASLPRTEIVKNEGGYLQAVQTSALMRYNDDFEFLLDAGAGVIHVRSASRVGYGDMGVNRDRIEIVRAALTEQGIVAGE
ncbi:MAG: DUF1499 domain-containing protein [bacterium]|nr:DUF1499 domain-containing protein [bacterium]